jgi:DNA-binding transcriptional LysR family regulator
MKEMELRHLRYLIAVADGGSYVAAADRLHVAQPGLWKQVRSLERELGVSIFERVGRNVRLTSAGEQIVARAREVLEGVDVFRAFAADLSAGRSGIVKVACVAPHVSRFLAPVAARLRQRHEDIEVQFREFPATAETHHFDPIEELRSRRVDLAAGLPSAAEVDGFPIYRIRIVAVVGDGHRWQGERHLSVRQLRGENLVLPPVGAASRNQLEVACREAGFDPLVVAESPNPATLVALGRAGMGIPVMSDDALGGLVPDPLPEVTSGRKSLGGQVHLLWWKGTRLSAAAQEFVSDARLLAES